VTWPIFETAGVEPQFWPGWPSSKRFAIVLTHDVESHKGLQRCHQLTEIETRLGFRSSFYFVPEGEYSISKQFRDSLNANGFEVGVHDLKHDGKLYRSRAAFSTNAHRINHYLKEWNAVGFRSGFMHHNLEWLHDLNIQYDASTFDVDPFEPQPDGVETIFPFWVPGANGGGYVELPYSLCQDFTVYVLLREKTIDIWKRKIEWIAKHGGMALVIVHPDYMDFSNSGKANDEFPAIIYEEFLHHIKNNYSGLYWNGLSREVAQHVVDHAKRRLNGASPRSELPVLDLCLANHDGFGPRGSSSLNFKDRRQPIGSCQQALRGKRAAVVVFSYYPSDPRPRRAAEALIGDGMSVELICLSGESETRRENFNGVDIFRLPFKRHRGGKIGYLFQYASFILMSFGVLAIRSLTRRYDVVHVHNMPDVLVFSALIPKLLGAKVILDLHDPMPELMVAIFKLGQESFEVRLLKQLERYSMRFADAVLTVNLACKNLFSSRSCAAAKICVVMNSPDEEIFRFRRYQESNQRDPASPFVIMYHGSVVERHGLDLAVQALAKIRKVIPTAELRIYGQRTPFLDSVMGTVRASELNNAVHYEGAKNLEQIVDAIGQCDVGIIPNRRSMFTEINTPTRIFEYLARGKPVIAPRTPGIQDYFGIQALIFFELGDAEDLAGRLKDVFFRPTETNEIVKRGQDIYLSHTWSQEKSALLKLVNGLLNTNVQPDSVAQRRPTDVSREA